MNEGKKFEQNFKASVPKDVYHIRLSDSAIGFDIENSNQRFSLKSLYDCILYRKPTMCCLELKSVKSGAISYSGSSPKIKPHQVKNLTVAALYKCRSGFVFNFRNTGNTYFVFIDAFNLFVSKSSKKSINEKDVKLIGTIIPCKKLKVNYRYDLETLFQ